MIKETCFAAMLWMLLVGFVPANAQTVNVWLTTHDLSQELEPQAPVSFVSGNTGGNPILVDESQTYQRVEGFGASFTDSAAWLLNEVATPAARPQAMQDLFTRNGIGIGLSFVRNPMGASDLTRTRYSYDDLPPGQTDVNLTNFSIAHDEADIIPLVKLALRLNPQLTIMATPWSPPGWMKTTDSMIGGSLLTNMYEPFAMYFVKYIQAYEAAGIPINYVSLQNEPLYVPGDYPGMYMDAATQTAILRDYVLPAFQSNNIATKILVYDHNWDQPSYPQTVLSDPTLLASSQIAGTAWHGYGGTPGVMLTLGNQFPSKGNYLTEHSGGAWVSDQMRQDFTEIIHVMRCGGKAYVKWSLAQDQTNGPNLGGCNSCNGLVMVDTTSGFITYNTDFYTLGHFSKFIYPGAYRIYSSDANGVVSAAFKNPSGSKALVAFNDTTASRTFQVWWGNKSFSYTLPAYAGATFTWSGTQSGTSAVNATNQIQASSFNRVSGIQTEWTSDSVGGYNLGYCDNGDYAEYEHVNFFNGFTNVTARVASFGGGAMEFRLDSPTGALAGSIPMPDTGDWQTYTNVSAPVTGLSGIHNLYLVFKGGSSIGNVNSFLFGTGWPEPWKSLDIGAVGALGSATFNVGSIELTGSGTDIESSADQFRYLYQNCNGDCGIVAQVATQDDSDPWAKAGVMIRESTADDSKNAAVLLTPGNGLTFQRRTKTGGSTTVTVVSGVTTPEWVKLVRSGNSFAGYFSPDGVNWTQFGSSQTINMAANATVGLAVTSHANGTLCSSIMDNVMVGVPAIPAGLTAVARANQVDLSWHASAGAISYNVKESATANGSYTTVANVISTNFSNIGLTNGVTYYYKVSALNAVGESADSSWVSAMPTNHPPVLAAIPDQTILAGRTLWVTNSASDADAPPQILTYSLPVAPAGASIETNSGVFKWRPAIAQSPSTQSVVVAVSDDGVPRLGATQGFQIRVLRPSMPALSLTVVTDKQLGFWINGDTGPDYTIQTSTNLENWSSLATLNSPALPLFWSDTNPLAKAQRFYRAKLGP